MKYSFFRSIRVQLLFLVLLSVLPALGILIYSGVERLHHDIEDARNHAQRVLRSLASDHEHVMESTRQFLMTLVRLPDVQNLDAPGCNKLFRALQKENMLYSTIFAANADGMVFSNALPFTPFSIRERNYFSEILRTKDFAVGEYTVGVASHRPVLSFGYPVLDSKAQIKGFVAGGIDLARYGRMFRMKQLPEGTLFGIFDHRNIGLYHCEKPENYIGKADTPQNIKQMSRQPEEGVFTAVGSDGVKRLHVYKKIYLKRSTSPYLFMRIDIPEEQVLSHPRNDLLNSLALLLSAFIIVLLLAWCLGKIIIVGRLNRLVDASHRLASGDLTSRTGIEHREDELGQVIKAFDAMAGELERKESQRKLSEEELQKMNIDLELRVNERTEKLEELNVQLNIELSERKRAEEELRDAEAGFKAIFDNANDGILLADEATKKFHIGNNAMCQMLGYSLEEIAKLDVTDIHPKEELPYVIGQFERQARREIAMAENLPVKRKDGSVLYADVNTSLVTLDGRKYLLGVFRDITERKRTEEKLEQAKETAETANRAKSEFLANMSHEIRTPMNGIIGMTELALGTDLTGEQREYLGMVKMSAESLLALINDILDFSKMEAHKMELEGVDFDLRTSLENAADVLALRAHEKGLELTCHIIPDVPTALVGDPARVRQVILNLAGNAIKFTDEGEVVIRVDIEEESEEGVVLHFRVSDTGIGIPPDKVEDIFESFSQVDGSTTRKYGGTGLGLTISRQLVEMMDGRIWVESPRDCLLKIDDCRLKEDSSHQSSVNSDQSSVINRQSLPPNIQSSIVDIQSKGGPGSVFHFTARFGLSRAEAGRPLMIPDLDLLNVRVLIVDNNATNRIVYHEMTSSWGLLPTTAEDGNEALLKIKKASEAGQPYGLLLLDLQMPGMDGFEVAKRVKKGPLGQEMEIILLTSSGQKGDAARCKEVGISGYLLKPVKQSDLLDAIMLALGHGAEEKIPVITRHTVMEARRRLKILLAEDNPVNQKLAAVLLQKRGHRVEVVSNGKEALEMLEKDRFDLVLMDVQMPEMDGLEATRRIRALELKAQGSRLKEGEGPGELSAFSLQPSARSGRVPIVAMTAHAMKGDRERCLEAGMDDYVSKPIKAEELFAVIEKISHESKDTKEEAGETPRALRMDEPPSKDVFDLARALEVVGGDRDLFKEISTMFLEGLPDHIGQIGEGVHNTDATLLERAAHSLKGSVGNFGAERAFKASCRLEVMGREGSLAEAAPAFAELEKELGKLEDAMKQALSEMTR